MRQKLVVGDDLNEGLLARLGRYRTHNASNRGNNATGLSDNLANILRSNVDEERPSIAVCFLFDLNLIRALDDGLNQMLDEGRVGAHASSGAASTSAAGVSTTSTSGSTAASASTTGSSVTTGSGAGAGAASALGAGVGAGASAFGASIAVGREIAAVRLSKNL